MIGARLRESRSRILERFPRLGPYLRPRHTPFYPGLHLTQSVFVHVPKTAGTSIKAGLYRQPESSGHRPIDDFFAYDSRSAEAFHKFAIVRNPWDRLLSAFSYLKARQHTTDLDNEFADAHLAPFAGFEAFASALSDPQVAKSILAYMHFKPQAHWTHSRLDPSIQLDFIGRYETIEADYETIRARLGLVKAALPHYRPSSHTAYQDAYSERTRKIAAAIYERDIDTFKYRF